MSGVIITVFINKGDVGHGVYKIFNLSSTALFRKPHGVIGTSLMADDTCIPVNEAVTFINKKKKHSD